MTHDDALIAVAFVSSVGGLVVLAGLAVFFINGGVIARARRRRGRERVVSQVTPPPWCIAALADVARAHRLLTRERLQVLAVTRERNQLQLQVDELKEQLHG